MTLAVAVLSGTSASRPQIDYQPGPIAAIVVFGFLASWLSVSAYSLWHDIGEAGTPMVPWLPHMLLGVMRLIALGFDFVNGVHDTANALAPVICTHASPPPFSAVWSGPFNLLGVLASSGAVAFGIRSLLPVELVLQVGSSAGFAMMFALFRRHHLCRLSRGIALAGRPQGPVPA